jgi:predicted phage terminase large subunit-like protein
MTSPTKVEAFRTRIRAELSRRTAARSRLLDFMAFVWWKAWDLKIGRHTRAIAARLDVAVEDFKRGKSTCLLIAVPFRHGKSDLVSRAFPPFFLASCRGLDPDVIISGYGQDLVEDYSKDCQAIIRSDPFRLLFPDLGLARGSANVQSWALEGSRGRVTAAGLGGALIGKGGSLILVDDYCKNRGEARSDTFRKKTWSAFQDILSRRAPVSIVIVCATPWHVDDVRGRIKAAMKKDPDFPIFEDLTFPAKNIDPETGKWDGTFLFEDRFPREWYVEQYAAQGTFAPALLDCDPQVEGGNRFDVSKVIYHDTLADFPNVRKRDDGSFELRGYKRAWDLASSEKERTSDDPDWTCGVKGYVVQTSTRIGNLAIPSFDVWVADMVYCRAEAPERDRLILDTIANDGNGTSVHIEDFGAYKDAAANLKRIVKGAIVLETSHLPGDKSAKLSPLEPVFASGRVHVLRAPWNEFWRRCFADFPDGSHDDPCDATAVLFDAFTKQRAGIASPEFYRSIMGRS